MKTSFSTFYLKLTFPLSQVAIVLFFLTLFANSAVGQITENNQPQPLESGKTIERQLTGNETHRYQFKLKNKEFFQTQIEQKGVDILLKMFDSKNRLVSIMDSPNGDYGFETLSFIANVAGNYFLEVSGLDKKSEKGVYTIKREIPRLAKSVDIRRVAIEKLFVEAMSTKDFKEQPQITIAKLELALKGWKELNDTYLIGITTQQINQLKQLIISNQTDNKNVRELKIGEKIERKIDSNELHFYNIYLNSEEVLQINLIEKNVNVKIGLMRVATNEIIAVSDFGLGNDLERLTFIVEQPGLYRVVITSLQENASGYYQLESVLKNKATEIERLQINGEKLLYEGFSGSRNEQELKETIKTFEKAVTIWQVLKEDYWQSLTLSEIGIAYSKSGNEEKALEYLRQSLLLIKTIEYKNLAARILNNIGLVYSDLGEKQKALEYFSKTLPLFKNIGDKSGEASTLNNIGIIYSDLGEKQKASVYFNQTLSLLKEVDNTSGIATTLNNMGLVYSDLGEKQKALDYFNQTLLLLNKVGDKSGEASTLNNMGSVYSDLGEKQKALEFFEKTLSLFKEVGDKKGEALVLRNIGSVYSDLGEKQKALEYFSKILPLFKNIGDKSGEASTLNNIGSVYSDLGEKQKALEYFSKILPLFKNIGDKSGEASTLNNIGIIYSDLGEKQKALEYFNQVLNLSRSIENIEEEATSLNNIGKIYTELGEGRKSLEYLNQALYLYILVESKFGQAQVLVNMMYVWEALNNSSMAIFCGKNAVNKYQEIRGSIKDLNNNTQRAFLETFQDTYKKLAEMLIENAQFTQAVEVIELYQNESLLEFNPNSKTIVQKIKLSTIESTFVQRYEDEANKIKKSLSTLKDVRRQIGTKKPNENEIIEIQNLELECKKFTTEYAKVFKDAETDFFKFPESSSNVKANFSIVVDNIQNTIRELTIQTKTKNAVLYTLIGKSKFSVILITSDKINVFQTPIKKEVFNKKLIDFYALLSSPNYETRILGKEIYDIVFKQVDNELKKNGIKTLMWSLDGNLRFIPMAALWDGEKYLVEEYQNVNLKGFSSEQLTRNLNPVWTGVGFGNSNAMTVNDDFKIIHFAALPGVKEELNSIFGKPTSLVNGELYLNEKFTKQAFFEVVKKKYSIIHISGYFNFNQKYNTSAFFALGDGSVISLDEIQKGVKDFKNVDLLVLSGCNTGLPFKDPTGKEVFEVTRWAQKLGAGAIMATLWSIDDNSTALLMRDFYQKKQLGATKAEALQLSQLSMFSKKSPLADIKRPGGNSIILKDDFIETILPFQKDVNKPYSHPYYWAPFILTGNFK
jgi:CHAT domain-containing protein/Tfp pilus assembly protein PilF